MKLHNIVMSLGLLGVLGTGCVVEVARSAYDGCTPGDVCTAGTQCVSAISSTGGTAFICSRSCSRTEDCPISVYGSGYAPTCVNSASRGGTCYDGCVSNADCGLNTICGTLAGGVDMLGRPVVARLCLPIGGTVAPACGGSGQACCAGSTCTGGLACGTAGVCGVPCGNSGQACCPGNSCSGGLACGTSGVCGVACGNAGQPCCPGNGAMCAAGLACGGTSTCITALATRNPYQKCERTTDACAGGAACILSNGRPQAKTQGTFCSLACTSSAACPAAGGTPAVCASLTGTATDSQCYRTCASQNDCAGDNTVCTMFGAGAMSVQVCVPAGPRA